MKKYPILFTALVACVFILNSCGDVETPLKYMTINGTKTDLSSATITDWGTDYDLTYREYELIFKTAETNPSYYIEMTIYSTSTTRLQEGTYTYESYAYDPGFLSFPAIGSNLQYDASNVVTSGTRLSESNSNFSGTVTVSMKNDNYYFTFDLSAEKEGTTYTIQGEYNDVLTAN